MVNKNVVSFVKICKTCLLKIFLISVDLINDTKFVFIFDPKWDFLEINVQIYETTFSFKQSLNTDNVLIP